MTEEHNTDETAREFGTDQLMSESSQEYVDKWGW